MKGVAAETATRLCTLTLHSRMRARSAAPLLLESASRIRWLSYAGARSRVSSNDISDEKSLRGLARWSCSYQARPSPIPRLQIDPIRLLGHRLCRSQYGSGVLFPQTIDAFLSPKISSGIFFFEDRTTRIAPPDGQEALSSASCRPIAHRRSLTSQTHFERCNYAFVDLYICASMSLENCSHQQLHTRADTHLRRTADHHLEN
jgi:hypothetical protein